jgi:hypothetical protein
MSLSWYYKVEPSARVYFAPRKVRAVREDAGVNLAWLLPAVYIYTHSAYSSFYFYSSAHASAKASATLLEPWPAACTNIEEVSILYASSLVVFRLTSTSGTLRLRRIFILLRVGRSRSS